MPNHKSSEKRVRGDAKKNIYNSRNMSTLRTAIKKLYTSVQAGNPDTKDLFVKAQSLLNKACNKGLLHKNNVSRKVSRLSKMLKVKSSNKA